jgi:hypothetical protein
MGNINNTKNQSVIAKQYNQKPENIIVEDNKIYLKQERSDVKLPQLVLKAFAKANDFSHDADDDKK